MLSISDLIYTSDPSAKILLAHYNWPIVGLSIFTAIITSVMALQLARTAQSQTSKFLKQGTIFSGAVCLGAGVWAMHFIGMMALEICTKVDYDPLITILSMLPAILAAWYSLQFLTTEVKNNYSFIRGGVVVGAGIGVMHYSGMMAMHMKLVMQFRLEWVAISVVGTIFLTTLALWVGSEFSRYKGLRSFLSVLAGGCIMGLAISAMHFTGMVASVFVGTEDPNFDVADNHSLSFALAVAFVTLLIAILTFSVNALTRSRKLNAEIKANELHLSTVLNTTKDSILTFNKNGKIQTFNTASIEMFQYDGEMLKSLSIEQLIIADLYQDKIKLTNFYNNTNTVVELDSVFGIKKDNSRFPVRVSIGDIELNGEKIFIVYVTDLTKQKLFESTAKEKDLQLKSLMNNIPGVAFRMAISEEGDHSLVLLSTSIKALTGFDTDSYLNKGSSIRQHILSEERTSIIQEINRLIKAGLNYQVEYRILDKNGLEHWISEYGSGQFDTNTDQFIVDGVMVDTSDAKLKNAAYESIVDAIQRSTCIASYTVDGEILDVNQRFLDVMGFERHEVVGQHHALFCPKDFVHTDEYKHKWQSLKAGQYVEGEYLRFGKNGKEVWIHASYNPLFDADGKVVSVLLFMMDISERVSMQKDLISAKDKAESAARAKATFLANMSHEIRTPMNAVIGYSDVMMDTTLDASQQNYLKTIQSSAKSLLHLLNDILDSAKLENGKLDFEEVNFRLDNLLDNVISTLWIQARKKDLQLELKIHPEASGFYLGAESRIRQVLMNITGNAVKFTEAGKVSIDVNKIKGNVIQIEISDTGIGIPEDRLEVIFDPFTQADTSMSRQFGGTGLGTTISKQFIEAMGGQISVQSSIGTGTCFTIQLPLRDGENAPVHSIVKASNLPNLKVLIADDIKQNRELLTLLLERDGHEVLSVSNGLEVLEVFSRQSFDLMILDVQMPEMDGLTAAKSISQIEASKSLEHTPIIALTASVLNDDRLAAKEAGMDGFATKPIDIEALYLEVSRVLGLVKQGETLEEHEVTNPSQESVQTIDYEAGIRRWGDELLYEKELQNFVSNIGVMQAELSRLAENLEGSEIGYFVHAQKGIAGNLSLKKLQELFSNLEVQLKQKSGKQIKASLDSIKIELTLIESSVNRSAKDVSDSLQDEKSNSNKEELSKIVKLLMDKAQRAEIDDELLGLLFNNAANQYKNVALEIQRSFNEFEFQKSEALLNKLKQELVS